MKIHLSILYFLCTLSICTQCTSTNNAFPDIKSLCQSIGPSSSIVGLGESTHGTNEFTTYRSEIVKDLVENYSYRIFILEAEYIICKKINNYILSGDGDSKALLKEINIWPWKNTGFLELINWMREYNIAHPSDPVHFFGMDIQFQKNYATMSSNGYYNNYPELIEGFSHASRDSILSYYPIMGKLILDIHDNSEEPSVKIKQLETLSEQILNETPSNIDLRFQYFILARIYQYANIEPKDLNYRDKNMAKMVDLIHQKLNKKAIIWAHNDHIRRYGLSTSDFIPVGEYLSKLYKKDYSVIGFDFKEGSFLANSKDQVDLYKRRAFVYKSFTETIAAKLNFQTNDYIITDCSSIKSEAFINCIGATYVNDPPEGDRYITPIHNNAEFDYIVHIKTSTPLESIID